MEIPVKEKEKIDKRNKRAYITQNPNKLLVQKHLECDKSSQDNSESGQDDTDGLAQQASRMLIINKQLAKFENIDKQLNVELFEDV